MDNMLWEMAPASRTSDLTTASSVQCQPWCVDGDGHPDEFDRLDQTCWGAEHTVPLLVEPTIHMGLGGRKHQFLTTHLEQAADGAAPARIFIGHNVGKGKSATTDEARRFALEILALVDIATA